MPRKYPHLLNEDIIVWERFLNSPRNIYTHFEYDIRVGDGRDPGPDFDPNIRRMALDLSQRRIDAIGHRSDSITIIELSVLAGLTQIGQLLAYPALYRQSYDFIGTIYRLLVAESLQSDIQPVLVTEKIPYVLV